MAQEFVWDQRNNDFYNAVQQNDLGTIRYYLAQGVNPNTGIAVARNEQIIRTLVNAGADPTIGLIEAVAQSDGRLVSIFLELGADPNNEYVVYHILQVPNPEIRALLGRYGGRIPNMSAAEYHEQQWPEEDDF